MKQILFVCTHNAARSQMAEAFFNSLADGKAKAISAGTMPASQVNPAVVQAMREVGIEISNQKPKLLTLDMMEKAERVITMGCGEETTCPASLVQTEDWKLEDPQGKSLEDVRRIRDEIKSRVIGLIKALKI